MTNARLQTESHEQRTSPLWARSGVWAFVSILVLCVPLVIGGGLAFWWAASFDPHAYEWLRTVWPRLGETYTGDDLPSVFAAWQVACFVVSAVWLSAAVIGLLSRHAVSLWIVRKAYIAGYLWLAFYAVLVVNITGNVAARVAESEALGSFGLYELFLWRCQWLLPAGLLAGFIVTLHVFSWRRAAINAYSKKRECTPAIGDQIVENTRTHGRDPRYRKSLYGSVFAHLAVVIIVPFLLSLRTGCIRPYRVPQGGGTPAVTMVKIVQPKKKKRKKYILSKHSAISFEAPDLEESELTKEVEESTRDTYTADTSAVHGRLGTGSGNKAGWADGLGDGEIRLIRLQYDGPGWDDGMNASQGADTNFLNEFQRLSGLETNQVARAGEAHPISHLTKYPKGQAPPFVYITGTGHIRFTDAERKQLREYIKGGGMIFADAGSASWDREFRSQANRLLPGHPLTYIADDDPIFQIPFGFPNGPPPLWFHGGKRSMGMKYKGRWAVFYFPGDLNDAWKTGHSGIDPNLAESAMHVGVNVVYYAVTRYLQATRKYRK